MPHTTFEMAAIIAADTPDIDTKQLVPGIEPGGSRVGMPTKPALLIMDAWIELIDVIHGAGGDDFNQFTGYIKMSQDQDMDPGIILPVAQVGGQRQVVTAVGENIFGNNSVIYKLFHEQGSIWAPKYVSAAWFEQGGMSIFATLHLVYEVIEIPWIEWFVKWDFLDNITNNAEAH